MAAVTESPAWAGEVAYRPSPARELRHALRGLDPAAARLALELARGQAELSDPRLAALSGSEHSAAVATRETGAGRTAINEPPGLRPLLSPLSLASWS